MADDDGSSAKVDDLDQVRVAGPFISVVVVASMYRVDGAGSHRIGLIVCRVKHRAALPEVVSCIHGTAARHLGHRAMGRTPRQTEERQSGNRPTQPGLLALSAADWVKGRQRA